MRLLEVSNELEVTLDKLQKFSNLVEEELRKIQVLQAVTGQYQSVTVSVRQAIKIARRKYKERN